MILASMILGTLNIPVVDLVWRVLLFLALAGSFTSTIYLALTLLATARHVSRARAARAAATAISPTSLPPVTIFKPVHGMEEQLAANLESFFQQDYPDYEVIFGARDADNPAAKIAEEIRARYPRIPSRMIISGPPEWPNAKVFSLDKMIAASSRSHFIISDSDVQVAPISYAIRFRHSSTPKSAWSPACIVAFPLQISGLRLRLLASP